MGGESISEHVSNLILRTNELHIKFTPNDFFLHKVEVYLDVLIQAWTIGLELKCITPRISHHKIGANEREDPILKEAYKAINLVMPFAKDVTIGPKPSLH